MSVRIYSNPENESNLMMTSDVEVFHSSEYGHDDELDKQGERVYPEGFYFWYCFGGCLPDSSPFGPYKTQDDAIFAAQNGDYC